MENKDKQDTDNSTFGLLTKIWGPHFWETLHCASFGYPINPTEDERTHYKNFFTSVGHVLPCIYCRKSYLEFIRTEPTILDDKVMANRETLTKWVYDMHQRVNKKLEMEYNITYDEVVHKYETFRARCDNKKLDAYRMSTKKDCPIISIDVAKIFSEYANKRNVDFSKLGFYADLINSKNYPEWTDRNNTCHKQIQFMRLNDIGSIEKEGIFKGLPTVEELKLMSMLSTNLKKHEIDKMIYNLGYSKKYKLIN